MLNGFEEQTADLNEEELKLVPLFVRSFQKYKKDRPISNREIREKLASVGITIQDSRVRKIVSYISINGIIPNLGADGRGYYIIEDREDLERYRESLVARAAQILRRAGVLYLPGDLSCPMYRVDKLVNILPDLVNEKKRNDLFNDKTGNP